MLNWFKNKSEKIEKTVISQDPEVQRLIQNAEQGDAEAQYQLAQYQLGLRYLEGDGLKKNEKAAAELFKKAMEQGHLDAQSKLAWCHLYGRGVKQNLSYSLQLSQDADGTHEKIDMNKFGYLIRK